MSVDSFIRAYRNTPKPLPRPEISEKLTDAEALIRR